MRAVLPFESSPGIAPSSVAELAALQPATDPATSAVPTPVLAEGSSRVATLEPAVDRRSAAAPATFAAMLFALTVLNAIDALMTLWAVRLGVATEANPIMAAALSLGEPVFFVAKMSVVGAGCAVLWAARHHRIARFGAYLCVAVYLAIGVVHIWTGAFIAEALATVAS